MKTTHILILAIGTFCTLANSVLAHYSFSTLQDPAGETFVWGISGNNIVGTYNPYGGGPVRSFLYDGVTYTTLGDDPLASRGSTQVTGISGTNIVGAYQDQTTSQSAGFLYDGTTYTALSVSDSRSTVALGVSGTNVVGSYQTIGGPNNEVIYNGFLYHNGVYTTLNDPLAVSQTWATGINANGDIVGHYQDALTNHGFLYTNGTWHTLDFPGAVFTFATGINDAGYIVGYYSNDFGPGSAIHGFVYNGSSFTTLDVPGNNRTWAQGISADGRIVGYSVNDGGVFRSDFSGFIASVPEPKSNALIILGFLTWALCYVVRRYKMKDAVYINRRCC